MNGGVALDRDSEAVAFELQKIGFDRHEIDRALDWLDGLIQVQSAVLIPSGSTTKAIRYYAPEECERLSAECRGFLLYLEQVGILDPLSREVVIDRLVALDVGEVDLSRVRWVVLMALFNQPEKQSALSLLQDMVFADAFDMLH